jgi:hypothetical protein
MMCKALFERIVGEATRRIEAERQEARSRSPLARLLLSLTIAASLLAAATLFYGAYRFPDAPIRQTADGYRSKHGQIRTQADFEAFRAWERAMFVVFPSAFGLGFAFSIADAMQRRKRERSV